MAEHDGCALTCACGGRGSDAFAYDPSLHSNEQSGLDRLRCVEDREIAELLFQLYRHIELRQSYRSSPEISRSRTERELQRLRVVASRALDGWLGQELQDMAEAVFCDTTGRQCVDEASLRAFGRVLATLKGENK